MCKEDRALQEKVAGSPPIVLQTVETVNNLILHGDSPRQIPVLEVPRFSTLKMTCL